MNTLFVDSNEPVSHEVGLRNTIASVVRAPLNAHGKADYYWTDIEGLVRQVERKQFSEALGDLESLEEQLNRELATCDELMLIVENVGLPTFNGMQFYKTSGQGTSLRKDFAFTKQPNLYARWQGLKWGLRHQGVLVIETPSAETSIWEIAYAYKASMKTEHTTFRRYVTPHVQPFNPNNHVQNLLMLRGKNNSPTGIGPTNAQKLERAYGTLWEILSSDIRVLTSYIGRARARKLLEAVGRELEV